MGKRQNNRKRQQRIQREIDRQVEQMTGQGPSEGQFCVYNKKTKEKFRGLNWNQAVELWNNMDNGIILKDEDVRNG